MAPHDLDPLGRQAWDALRRMAAELLARKPGGHLVEAELDRLDLRLPLVLRGPDADAGTFSSTLIAALDRLLDEAVQRAAAFRPGHVWCHRCGSATCEHSESPSCRHVFAGYAPTGLPRWEEFAQFCLRRRHPDIQRLYEDPPAFLTIRLDRDELHAGLLDAFQHDGYELLGQVTAGFFVVRAREEEGRGVLALTVQAAASRFGAGEMRLGLNVLGRAPGGAPLDALWSRQHDLPWRRAVRWAQAALQDVAHKARNGGRDDVERRVGGVLGGLARRLQRQRRSRGRRTDHAEERHLSGDRPTRMAVEDVRGARDEAFLVDDSSGTLVVLGDRGRTHFFTPEGRLVSSVRYSRDAIGRKRKVGRWRRARRPEITGLRGKLAD